MNRPTLSICIPTYNRAHYLEECLESINIQLTNNRVLSDSIEVVVSDNHSTDNTAQIAKKYESVFKNFKYALNDGVEYDLNVYNAVKNSTGKYCWYMGDDDVIMNGGLELIYNCLKDDHYDVACVEAEPITASKDYLIKKHFSKNLLIEENDFNEFYFKGYCKGILSVLIFNREIWIGTVDTLNYLKSCLYYETVLKMLVSTQKKMLYIKQPIVMTGQDCRWAENGGELFTFINFNILSEVIIAFGFDKEIILKGLIKNNKRLPIILLMAKGHGLKCNIENLKYIYKNSQRVSFLRLCLVTLIYFIPNWLVVIIRDFRKYLKN